jgi:hypothetical protein
MREDAAFGRSRFIEHLLRELNDAFEMSEILGMTEWQDEESLFPSPRELPVVPVLESLRCTFRLVTRRREPARCTSGLRSSGC